MSDEEALFSQLEDVFDSVDETEIVDMTTLTEWALRERFVEIEATLKKLGQVLWPHTQEARDLHSERNAIQIELRRRGKSA